MNARPRPRWQRRHQAVLEWLLANPSSKLGACAQATGYSRTHISRIINAPDFQRKFRHAVEERSKAMMVARNGFTANR